MSEENKAILNGIMQMFVSGDTARAADLLDAKAVDHQGIPGVDTNGPEGFQRVTALFHAAFPDMKISENMVIAEGDLAMSHFRMTGTNKGEFMGMPATGKAIDIEGVDIVRFANGKAVEHWGYYEEAKMMQQLGLMPSAPS